MAEPAPADVRAPAGRVPDASGAASLARAATLLGDAHAHTDVGRPAAALPLLREALVLLGEPEDPVGAFPPPGPGDAERDRLAARVLVTLAYQLAELEPAPEVFERRLARVLALAERADAPDVVLTVHGQRGLDALRHGDRAGALEHLDRGAEHLDDAAPRDAATLLLNRGTLHLERGDVEAAVADLAGCVARARAAGDANLVFKGQHNLGYAEFLAGRLPEALAAMEDAAERHLPGLGEDLASTPIALLDRAQVLVEVGLLSEADDLLARAGAIFAERGLDQDRGEVDLLRARCARLLGRDADAVALARSAGERLAQRGSTTWVRRARLVELRSVLDGRLAAGAAGAAGADGSADGVAGLHEVLAGALDLAGTPALRGTPERTAALVLAAEAHVALGEHAAALRVARAARRSRWGGGVEQTVALAAVRAACAFAEESSDAGVRAVRAGQRALAEHRARFGSVEAVVASGVYGERLAIVDVVAALASGDPRRTLDAAERGRTLLAGLASVRPAPGAEDLAVELRRASEELRLEEPVASPRRRAELHARAADVRARVRAAGWAVAGAGGPVAARPTTAREVLPEVRRAGTTLAELVAVGGRVHAVVAGPAGERLLDLGPVAPAAEAARRLHADLRVLARPGVPPPLRDVALRSAAQQAETLDALVARPLGAAGALHVVGPAWCVSLPWSVLPSRRGLPTSAGPRLVPGRGTGRRPRVPDAPGPSSTSPAGAVPGRVAVVAGPDVPAAAVEVERLAALHPGALVLAGEDATCAAVLDALRTHDVVHLAAHGEHAPDNPLFSSVRLADGPLVAHDVATAPVTARTVVLAACELGTATERPGGLPLGLASVLLGLGACHVVGAVTPVADAHAHEVVVRLHEGLAAGLGPSAALAGATADVPEPSPFVCLTTSPVG